MKVQLIAHSENPEKIIACAAKLCYSSSEISQLYDGLTDEKVSSFVDMLSSLGHQSPVEHVTFTFGIEGVSRAFLAQITRHRIASYSVQSQRYVSEKDTFQFITPPAVSNENGANEIYQAAMQQAIESYRKVADILEEKYKVEFLEKGMSEKAAASKAEKLAIEDARFILPNACETKMIVTMNARSLMNFFALRCCNRAQWEIRAVANEMLRLVCSVAPTLFQHAGPDCVRGHCSEGKMSCGKQEEMKEFYKNLKNQREEA